MCFKNLEEKPERESSKRTISASGELGLLQMVLEPNTGRCVSKEAESQRGVDWRVPHRLEKRTSASLLAEPQRGWIVRSHISWRGEQSILYKGVETSP